MTQAVPGNDTELPVVTVIQVQVGPGSLAGRLDSEFAGHYEVESP